MHLVSSCIYGVCSTTKEGSWALGYSDLQVWVFFVDHSQKVFKLILNCYELSKSTDSEPYGDIHSPQLCWLFSLEWLTHFCARSPTSFIHMSFWCPFLEHAPNHPPLKYMCLIKVSDQIRPAYLNSDLTHNWIKSSGCICAWALGTHGCVNLQRASRVYGQFWTCWRSHACVWGAWALGQSYWLLLVIYHGHNPFNNYVLCNSKWADILFWRAVSAMLCSSE